MGLTTLQVQGEGLGAAGLAEFRGATTAARFGDPQAEFRALRESCGVYDLGYRTKVSVTGRDRVRWLNGMVTNNIRDLAAGRGVYAFLLNPQGHILGDLYAFNRGESLLLDTDSSQAEKVLGTLKRYIIMDQVELKDLSAEMTALGIAGPRARDVLRAANLQIPELQPLEIHTIQCDCDCGCVNCTIVRSDNAVTESYEIWLAPEHVRPLWDTVVKAGATPVGSEARELQRIASGIPLYGVDIRERELPHETEQMRALNFSKGCYIGQEIVERIRSRGAVHRKFSGFSWENGTAVIPGAKVFAGEKEVGEITSVHSFGEGQRGIGLGYIRREAATPGKEVVIGDTKGEVAEVPFQKI